MTRQEAVKILEFEKKGIYKSDSTKEALGMAITALSTDPTLDAVSEYCNDRNIEMVAKDWLDSLNESLEKAVIIARAYEESLNAFNARLEELEHETELLNADLKDGVKGVGMTRKCIEVSTKKKLLNEVICLMIETLEEIKKESAE